MNNDRSSEIISNNETSETVLQTQPVSIINPESDNSFALKKLAIFCIAGVLALSIFFIFAKGTDVCLAINCNDYSDSVATGSASSTSVGNEFLIYAGSAATLVGLTLVGVPLLPAIAVSAGVWFFVHLVH